MPARRRWILVGVVVVLAGAALYAFGLQHARQARWHSATVDVADVAVDGQHRLLSIQADGWTYAIQDSVRWSDGSGMHESGWPACLEPRHPGVAARNHARVPLRFAELTADVDGSSWRPVVMVKCPTG